MHAALGRKEKYLANFDKSQLQLIEVLTRGPPCLTKYLIMVMCFPSLPCA